MIAVLPYIQWRRYRLFFATLPLAQHGLEYIYPSIAAAHPFDDGSAAALQHSVKDTAASLGADENVYLQLVENLVRDWPKIAADVLGPLHFPNHPLLMARFGLNALQPATWIAKRFTTEKAKGLWAGMTAHAIQPLSNTATAAIGLVLMAAGHLRGWPVPKGGAIAIGNALASLFISLGGKIETNFYVQSLNQLPSAHAVLFDVTPKQLLQIAGHKFSSLYKWQLQRYRYGMGVFKVDWALDAPIPFTANECKQAGTVHIGNTFKEIAAGEQLATNGGHPEKPFVLLAQQSLFDASRAPAGKHTAWAYCHTPNGSTKDMTAIIENQIERFAPGFRENHPGKTYHEYGADRRIQSELYWRGYQWRNNRHPAIVYKACAEAIAVYNICPRYIYLFLVNATRRGACMACAVIMQQKKY